MSLATYWLIVLQVVTFTLVWLALYMHTVHQIRGSRHPWDNNRYVSFCVGWAAILSYSVGNAAWFILALTVPSLELIWWHAIVSFLANFFLAVGGGIETAKYDLSPRDRSALSRAVAS